MDHSSLNEEQILDILPQGKLNAYAIFITESFTKHILNNYFF